MKKNVISFLVVLMSGVAVGQVWDSAGVTLASSITEKELSELLHRLAADDYEGRETGKAGQKKAAEFITDYYRKNGVTGPSALQENGGYYQRVPLVAESMTDCHVEIGKEKYLFVKDFYRFPGRMPEQVSLEKMVFCGYGRQGDDVDDFTGVELKGKVVMVIGRSESEGNTRVDPDYRKIRNYAESKGATGLVVVNSAFDTYITRIKMFLEQKKLSLNRANAPVTQELVPTVFVSPTLASALLKAAGKRKVKHYIKRLDKQKVKAFDLNVPGGKVVLNINTEAIDSENILAYFEGSDPGLKDQIVIVTAHYDHVGIIDGEIYNGADDDGSGTVCAMTIATALQRATNAGYQTRRSILIMHVTGEEKGLLGSEWYTDYPVFPLDSTMCNLNIDMVGRHDAEHDGKAPYVYMIGSDFISTGLKELTEQCRESYSDLEYDYRYNTTSDPNRFYYRSDHYNFAKNGIPSVFYFSGVHEDYHRPGDDAEKIDYAKLQEVARLVFMTVRAAANRDEMFLLDVDNVD